MPPRTPRPSRFERPLGVRHGGSALTCGELDLGAHPATPDPRPPPGVLAGGPLGQPPGRGEAAEGEVVGGEAEQGVGPGPGGVETVRVGTGFEARGLREGLAIEGPGLPVAAQLPPVRAEGAGGERGHEGVVAAAQRVQEGRSGGVPPLCTEHDGGEQPFPRKAIAPRDGRLRRQSTPEGGGAEVGFVHPSFVAGPTDKT